MFPHSHEWTRAVLLGSSRDTWPSLTLRGDGYGDGMRFAKDGREPRPQNPILSPPYLLEKVVSCSDTSVTPHVGTGVRG